MQDLLRHRPAVDRKSERTADARVVEIRAPDIAAIKVNAEVGIGPERARHLPAVRVDPAGGQRIREMELPGTKGAFLGVEAFDRIKMDRPEAHPGGVPVGWGFFQDYDMVRTPGLEAKGPVFDHVGGQGPAVAPLVDRPVAGDGFRRDGGPGPMGQQGKKIRGAMLQGDPQGSGVDRLGADLGEIPVSP